MEGSSPFHACWFSICPTHFLADLQTRAETSRYFLSPPLHFAVFAIAPASHGYIVAVPIRLCSAAQFYFFSGGEGHGKAIPLSLDVCFRCPFRDIWTAPCWRACVHISSTRRKTKKRTFFFLRCTVGLLKICCTLMPRVYI